MRRRHGPLGPKEVAKYKKHIKDDWEVADKNRISKEFLFVNFKHTMDFVNKVAYLAEEEGHHPVMHDYSGRVTLNHGRMPLTDYRKMILSWPLKLIKYHCYLINNLDS